MTMAPSFDLGAFVGGRDVSDFSSLSLSELFEEEPVSLDIFLHDRKYLGQTWNLSPIQEQAVRVSERVYLPEIYPLMGAEFGGYWEKQIQMRNLITFQWGKGSGKDHVCRIISLRVAYLLLCLKSPQLYYGMPEDDSIHMLNIAANSGQANKAFFTPLTKQVKRGWFKDKAEPKRDTIDYAKNLQAVSGHSDAEGQEGLNLILGVADEIDAFKAKDEMVGQGKRAREASTSAESILKMLKGSASTRFPHSYKRVAISYPRYLGSTIQKLTTEAKEDMKSQGKKSIYFASGPYATWEVNPLRKGKQEFASDYRTDPEEAAAMYECKPTRATNPYFRHPEIFKQAVDHEEQPIKIDYELTTINSTLNDNIVHGWQPIFTFADSFKPIAGARYALHGDLATVGDRAGIAMSHIEKYDERTVIVETEDGHTSETTEVVPIIRNDFVFGFEADLTAKPSREIQIYWVRQLVLELTKRGFYISRFTFDGFQSTDVIQTLTRWGIESEKVSADKTDDVWKTLKSVASEGRLHMPFEQLLLNELEGLSRIDGKVDHQSNGSKDLADAFACSIVGAINSGGEEDPSGENIEVGINFFELGDPLSELIGVDDMFDNGVLAMPIGMGGVSDYGW